MTCGIKNGKTHLFTPLQAIRRKCLDCVCGSPKEVELCVIPDCSLSIPIRKAPYYSPERVVYQIRWGDSPHFFREREG